MRKRVIEYLLLLVCAPAVVIAGCVIFKDKQYAFVSLAVAVISLVPFLMRLEHKKTDTEKLVLIAVMTALSVVGRFAFGFLPHFKPVTAVVVIAGMYLGTQAGFLCGAFSAVISNFIFGQGPWTPFEMLAWGVTGLLAALLSGQIKKSRLALGVFAVAAGVLYSLIMDIWTVLWADNGFSLYRFLAVTATALPVTATYAVSNVIFLELLARPIGSKLDRLKTKFGIT